MAKVVIEIEDNFLEGTVKMTMTPSFEMMMKQNLSGEQLTAAQAYALAAARHVRMEAKKEAKKIPILIPRIGR